MWVLGWISLTSFVGLLGIVCVLRAFHLALFGRSVCIISVPWYLFGLFGYHLVIILTTLGIICKLLGQQNKLRACFQESRKQVNAWSLQTE